MKNLLFALSAMFLFGSATAADPKPGSKAYDRFVSEFPCSSNVQWTELEDQYEVHFNVRQTKHWLLLNKRTGTQVRLLKYYQAPDLDARLRDILRREYPHTSIGGITEINVDSGTFYRVVLSNKKHIYIVMMDSAGNMELKEKFNNAS